MVGNPEFLEWNRKIGVTDIQFSGRYTGHSGCMSWYPNIPVCLQLLPGVKVVIANPETRGQCADSHLGEIWITTPPDATQSTGMNPCTRITSRPRWQSGTRTPPTHGIPGLHTQDWDDTVRRRWAAKLDGESFRTNDDNGFVLRGSKLLFFVAKLVATFCWLRYLSVFAK